MTLKLSIKGKFNFTVCTLDTETPIDNETALGVLDNIQQGEYIVDVRNRNILDINDIQHPIYSFVLEETKNSEFEFDEL